MEDDVVAETTSIDFSVAPSDGCGDDVAGGSRTESSESDHIGVMQAGRGNERDRAPTIQVPKPARPQPPLLWAPFGDGASVDRASSPAASPPLAHWERPITSFQAIRPVDLLLKEHLSSPSLTRDVSLDFVRAVQRLDSECVHRSRSHSIDNGDYDDNDSDCSGCGATAKQQCPQGTEGCATYEGKQARQASRGLKAPPAAKPHSPALTPPPRELSVLEQQPTKASSGTAATTTADESIHFEEETGYNADEAIAAPVAAAAPPSRFSVVRHAAPAPAAKPRVTADEPPQAPASPPAQPPRYEPRGFSPSSSRHNSPGYTVSAATAATITGTAGVGGATLPTVSLMNHGLVALREADPQHSTPHPRVLSSSVQNEEDPMYCTVSEMTMANPVPPQRGGLMPLVSPNTDPQHARGASGGQRDPSPSRTSLRPPAAGRQVQSSDFSFDESNALLTPNTPREVVKSTAGAPRESAYFRYGVFEDGAELASTSMRTQSTPGLHGKHLPHFGAPTPVKRTADGRTTAGGGRFSQPAPPQQGQRPSSLEAIPSELKHHTENEKADETGRTLRSISTLPPRETRVRGKGRDRGNRSVSSILKSFPSKFMCGRSRNSVAAKSSVDEGGECHDARTSLHTPSSTPSTRSNFASGLARLSSMFKSLVSGAANGSVEVKTPRSRPLSSSSSQQQQQQQQQRLAPQHANNAATVAVAAASPQMAALESDISITKSNTNLRSVDVLVGPKQWQPPPAVTPSVTSAHAVKSGRTTPTREATSSWHGNPIDLHTDEEVDRGCDDGVVGVAPLIPPAAATLAMPVEGASGSTEEIKVRCRKKDTERPEHRRRHHRHHEAETRDHTSSSASASVSGDGKRSRNGSAGGVDTSSSSEPSAPALCAEKDGYQGREKKYRGGPQRPRHRREGQEQRKEQVNGVSKCPQPRPTSPVPSLKSQSSEGGASSDDEPPHTFLRRCEGTLRHNCADDNADRGSPSGSVNKDCRRDAAPPPPPKPVATAATLAMRRRELRAKSRVASSVNHFAVSWHTRQVTRHRQKLLRHAERTSFARLQNSDAVRKSGSEEAASRHASRSQWWSGSQRAAVKTGQSGTALFSQQEQQRKPGRLDQYEAALTRDILQLDVIVEKLRRRQLWAEASPEAAAAAATAAEAEAAPSRQSLRGAELRRTMATHASTAGPLPSRVGITATATAPTSARMGTSSTGNNDPDASPRLSHPHNSGSRKANEVKSVEADGRSGRDVTTPAQQQQQQQRPNVSAACTSHASTSASVLGAVRSSGVADSGNCDAEADPSHSNSAGMPGKAAQLTIGALQRRYEQLLDDLVSPAAPQPPATTESDDGGTTRDVEVSMEGYSRHIHSARRHLYPDQHLSREQDEGNRNRRVTSSSSTRGRRLAPAPAQVSKTMEAEVARCAAALRAEYYQSQLYAQNQPQVSSRTIERSIRRPAAQEAGTNAIPMAHVAAAYAQALRPSCVACRPQELDEYITLGLLSMMYGGAEARVNPAAVVARESSDNVWQAHVRPVPTPTLVQRRIREDLYAAPRRCPRRQMGQAGGEPEAFCSNGNIATDPPITSVSVSLSTPPPLPHPQSAGAAAAAHDIGLSPQAETALASPVPSAPHPFTPTPTVIYGALLTKLMQREHRARRVRFSQEQEARYALQRLYVVETILVLRAAGSAAVVLEQDAPGEPVLPASQGTGGAASVPAHDRRDKRSGTRGTAPVVVTDTDFGSGESRGTQRQSDYAPAAPLRMQDARPRSPPEDDWVTQSGLEVDAVEQDAEDDSSLPAVRMALSSLAADATEVEDQVQQAEGHGTDLDVTEERNKSGSSVPSVLLFHVEDIPAGAALHHPVVASVSSTASIRAAAARPFMESLAMPSTASSPAAEQQPLSIDKGEHITDSDRHGSVDNADGTADTVEGAPNGSAAASVPSTRTHTDAVPHRCPPPVPPSSSAASSTSLLSPHNPHMTKGEGAVDAAPNGDGIGAKSPEAVALDAVQCPVRPVKGAANAAMTAAAAAGTMPNCEQPASAGDELGQAPEDSRPQKREQQRPMATGTASTAAPATPHPVRVSFPPGVMSNSDGEVKETSDAWKQTRWEEQETSHADRGPQMGTPASLKHADSGTAAAGDEGHLAIDLLEKLNGLDALLLSSFPDYFTTGTDEDGLPGVVTRRHPHLAESIAPLAEGRDALLSPAARAAAADVSPFDAYVSDLRGHCTPPRLPPESLASQLRRKYGLPQPAQQH